MGYLSIGRAKLSRSIQAGTVAVLTILTIQVEAGAATYYVNNQSSSASDSNPGTEALPWRTISKAATTVQPGDSVIVRPGQYNERVNFNSGNLSSATVATTFRADPPRQASMRGFDTLRAPNLKIIGFDITVPQSSLSSDWTAKYAIFIRSSGVEIRDNYIHDVPGAGIHAYWTHPWPSNVVIRDNYLTRVNQGIVAHGYNWLIENNEVTRLVVYNMDCDYMRFFGRNITIRGNYLHGARLSDIGNSHVDAFQTFPNNGWIAEDILIDSNYCESFHQGAMLGVADWANHSGYIRNLTFTNNVFVAGEIGGSWGILNAHVENTVIRHNLFLNMQYHGVGIRFGGSGTVQNNIFINNGHQNYYVESGSTMVGGYNLMDRMPSTPLYTNPNDIVANPRLVNLSNLIGADGRPFTADDGYRLRSDSPAINAALGVHTPRDIFGSSRPYGPATDIGPHEFGSEPDDGGGGDDEPVDTEPATYYVDGGSTSASDSNAGTESAPWRTLAKASAAVKPGDTVIVRAGVYNERVSFYGGNLSAATTPTTFIADPPRSVLMRGFDTQLAPHLKIHGFEISIPESLLTTDGTARYAIYVRSDGVEVVNNYIHDAPGVAVHAAWTQPWPKDVIVRGNTIVRVSQGIAIYGENWLVEENEIRQLVRYDMDCDYMRFFGRNITIRRNHLHGSNETDLNGAPIDAFQTFPNNGWYAENVTIDSNICQSFHRGAMLGGGDYASQTGYVRNITVTNNVFAGGSITGSHGVLSVGAEDVFVQNNLFLNLASDGGGTMVGSGATAVVQNNIFYNTGYNYWPESGGVIEGGYNMLNRVPSTPRYENPQDIVADPQLVSVYNLAGADGRLFTTDDGYLLQSTSPAIDRAGGLMTIATDILGRSRPYGSAGDIGPHESREVDKKARGKRKKFRSLDTSPKDGRLDMTEAQFDSAAEFAAVDTSGDGYVTMDELIVASLGLAAGRADVVWVTFGHTGPETGDEATPFATLDEGLAFVRAGGELRIRGRASDLFLGPLSLKKGVRMVSVSGVSQIGVPDATRPDTYRMTSNTSSDTVARETASVEDGTGTTITADANSSDSTGWSIASAFGGVEPYSGTTTSDSRASTADTRSRDRHLEPVLPSGVLEDGTRVVVGAQPIAVRVAGDQRIDRSALWAEVPAHIRDRVRVDWISHHGQGLDVWVRITPDTDWASLLGPEDEGLMTVSAGAGTLRMDAFAFHVVADARQLDLLQPLPELAHGIGLAYEIVPEEAYDAPVAVEIALEPGLRTGDVELMYYDHSGGRWIPARQVIGFIADATIDGETLHVTFNHAGIVQLRIRQ